MKTKQLFVSLTLGLGLTLALLWLLSGGAPSAHADSPHYVAPGGVCGGATPCHATIQEAVDAAIPGDEILVATGVYTGVNVRPRNDITTTGVVTQVVYISKTVTIRGGYTTTNWSTPYPITQPITLDAQEQGRVLYITGPGITVTLEGLRITGGDADGLQGHHQWWHDLGGGVYVISATAVISNNEVFSNTAFDGGGLCLYSSAATLSGNTVYSNTAGYSGGGLYLYDSAATLSGNTVTSNTVSGGTVGGGGLCLLSSDATLNGNIVTSNTASYEGGGLFLDSSDATLSGNTVTFNTAGLVGGGLYLGWGNAMLNGNTVTSNTASYEGGGLYLGGSDATLNGNTVISNTAESGGGLCLSGSDATLSGNTVISNTADGTNWWDGGGGLLLYSSDATLTNNVVADNRASIVGSGLYIVRSSPRLLHTTIARNTGGDGSGVLVTDGAGNYSTVTLTNTILVSHTVGITVTGGNTVTVSGVLWYGTPVTVSQAATATVTVQDQHEGNPAFAPDGYHLTDTSAAIDRGVNARVTTDIDGDARPDGCSFDLGADEFMAGTACKRSYLPLIMRQYQ